jgi:hypothetical protein
MKQSTHYLQDTSLPHLARALDCVTIRDVCRDLLRPGSGFRVAACRVLKLRYRRWQRAIIQYEITLVNDVGKERSVWLAGYLYASRERFETGKRRLERLLANPDTREDMLPGVAIESLELLLLRFPYDRRLPALTSFYFNIEQLVGERLPLLFGDDDWRLDSLDTRPVRWRVGLSAVACISVVARHAASGATRKRELYLKHDPGRPESAAESRLAALERDRGLPFALCPTVLSLPRQGLSIQAAAEGVSLETRLARGMATSVDANRLAALLARWHTSGEPLQRPYAREKFEAVVERSVRALSAATPENSGRLQALAAGIRLQMLHRLQCPVHLDLKPEHIYIDSGKITLIDLDSAADADPILDIAILYARLRHGQELYGSPKTASRAFANQLIRAYAPLVPPSWWYNFRVCYAWALLKVAMHLFACQRPGWTPLTGRFLREAELALESSSELLSFLPHREASLGDAVPIKYWPNPGAGVEARR